jgi:hypothetical protein
MAATLRCLLFYPFGVGCAYVITSINPVFLEDLDALEKENIMHIDVSRIRALFSDD